MKNKIENIHCYEERMWSAYHSSLISEVKRSDMEEHLLICDSCLSIYLSVLEEDTNIKSVPMLREDFTDRVMEAIEEESHNEADNAISMPAKKNKEVLTSKVTILLSYCAAASMALFFWGGGYFEGLSSGLVKGFQYIDKVEISQKVVEPQRGLIQSGWSNKVQETRPSFIDTIISKKE